MQKISTCLSTISRKIIGWRKSIQKTKVYGVTDGGEGLSTVRKFPQEGEEQDDRDEKSSECENIFLLENRRKIAI